MEFTYSAYKRLINQILDCGYVVSSYDDCQDTTMSVILRHDIDNDIEKALKLAKIEKELNVKSTYFVLVTSDFYNIFSAKNQKMLKEILECGHEIGLHFDELRYSSIATPEDACIHILNESKLLSQVIGKEIRVVSMHRPSKMILESDLKIPGMINSYGKMFFSEYKYVSDSRRCWREPIEEIIHSREYKRLHILTHAFWYNESEKNIHDSVYEFINDGNRERWCALKSNITDLPSIMMENEIR